jgi:ABC-2 type transport system ATP-binding protein
MLTGVSKRFGATVALADVSLAIEEGSTGALLGPNGAGKSTLSGIVLGWRTAGTGSVRILGRDPRDHRARAVLGAVPQETLFPQTLRVRELLEFVARHYAEPLPVADALEQFGLDSLAGRQAGGLSVGQRRRLSLAMAFVGRPRLLVLDEPTAALDRDGRRVVWTATEAARAHGCAVLLATHQLDEAEAVATRVVAIDHGRVVADGSVAEVKLRAGGARIRFRATEAPAVDGARLDEGWAVIETAEDAGAVVQRLVAAGIALPELEVRSLTLVEALEKLGSRL